MRKLMTLGLVLGAALAASPLAAQAPAQLYAQLSEQLAIDTKCNVLSGNQRLAMELFADEYRAQVTPADQTAVATWLEGVKTALAGVPCNDPRLTGPTKALRDAATIQQDIFAARVQAIGRMRGSTNWMSMSQISGVKSSAANRAMDNLRARNPEGARQLADQSYREVERVLSVLCPAQSIVPDKCPALLLPLNPGETEFAAAWLARVEKFAAQMPGARLDGKPVLPEGINDWSTLHAAVSMDMALALSALGMPCEASSYVVRADGPLPRNVVEITPATVFSARDGFEVGRGEITEYGARFQLRGQWIERLGMQPMGLVRCHSAP